MNEVQIFSNPHFGSVRTITQEGEPWFVAADVCRALEISDTSKAVSRLDADEKGTTSTRTLGGMQRMLTVNEYGLYNLILASRKPEAREFKRWITHEVIPSIRKNGGYVAGQDELGDDELIARALIVANRQIEAKNRVIERMLVRPMLDNCARQMKEAMTVGEFADYLNEHGIGINDTKLYEWMRENGYLCRSYGHQYNEPTQRSKNLGLFDRAEITILHANGSITTTKTWMLTGIAQSLFAAEILNGAEHRM